MGKKQCCHVETGGANQQEGQVNREQAHGSQLVYHSREHASLGPGQTS